MKLFTEQKQTHSHRKQTDSYQRGQRGWGWGVNRSLELTYTHFCCSVAQSCPTLSNPWTAACQASLSFTITRSLLKLVSIESVMPSNHLILCHPLFLLPSIFPSIRIFSSDLAHCIRQPKYWSFSFSVNPFNEYSGLISFRIDWFDLLSGQGTLRVFSRTTIQKH